MEDQIHFCHLTDSHLGIRQYGLVERFDDFAKAFLDCINKIISLSPDFILFTGDLFDSAKPQAPELRQAVKILNKVRDAKIPMFLSQGNHDVSYSRSRRYGGDVLNFLADFGLFKYIQDELIQVTNNEQEPIALILGVNYYGKRTDRVLNQLLETHKAELETFEGPKILMLHGLVQGMPGLADVKVNTIQKMNFDYVAVGHLHDRFENNTLKLYCPGSTEHTSATEWKQPQRGFCDVYLKNNGGWATQVEHVTINTRPKCFFRHEFQSASIQDIREEAEAFLRTNDIADAILRVEFIGTYKGKEHPFINLEYFRSVPTKALHTIIITKFLEAQKLKEKTKILSKREAYKDILINILEIDSRSSDDYISLIEETLGILGGEKAIQEQEKRLDRLYDSFAKDWIKKYSGEEKNGEEN